MTCQIPIPSIGLLYKHMSFLSCRSLWPETWHVCGLLAIPLEDLTAANSLKQQSYRTNTREEGEGLELSYRASMGMRRIFQTISAAYKSMFIVWTC